MNKLNRKEFAVRIGIILIAVIIAVYLKNFLNVLEWAWGIIFPFLVGMGIAYIWNLIMSKIEDLLFSKAKSKWALKLKRPVSLILSLLIILLVIGLILYLVIPQLYESIVLIGESIPKLLNDIYDKLMNLDPDFPFAEEIREKIQDNSTNWQDYSTDIINFARENFGGFLGSTMGFLNSIVGLFVAGFTAIIFGIYLLTGKEKLGEDANKIMMVYIPDEKRGRVRYLINVLNDKFSSFFKGIIIDALAIGIVLYILMLITGLPYAITTSVVVAVTALIPMVGAFIGGAVGFIMIAAQSFSQAGIFLIVLVIAQQLENDLIYPKLVGDSIGLPGIWTFAAIIIGGGIAGPIGMILFIPIVAALYKVLFDDVDKKIAEKRIN